MKKNFIHFNATQFGIECEGVAILSEEDMQKVEQDIKKIENAAKDSGATLETVPKGIKLTFIIASSCDHKCIDEADARMKCIIEEMREFISNLEEEKDEKTTEDELVVKQQHEAIDKFFDEMHEKYPNAKLTIICDDNDWISVASNMHPMHALHCMVGAINADKHGENQ